MRRVMLMLAAMAMMVALFAAVAYAQASISSGGYAVITSSKAEAPSWRARAPLSRLSATQRPTPTVSVFPGPALMEAHGDQVRRPSRPSSATALRRTVRLTALLKPSSQRQRSPWSGANAGISRRLWRGVFLPLVPQAAAGGRAEVQRLVRGEPGRRLDQHDHRGDSDIVGSLA